MDATTVHSEAIILFTLEFQSVFHADSLLLSFYAAGNGSKTSMASKYFAEIYLSTIGMIES